MSRWRTLYEQRRAAQQQAERDQHELWRICLHESSHAAAVHLLGGEIERVAVGYGVLDDSLSLSGGCFWRMRGGEKIPPSIMLRVALAGGAADRFFCGRTEDMYGGDGRAAWAAAAEIAEATGRDACDISRAARLEAEQFVRQYEAAITALARALLAAPQHELSGEQVERCLAQSGVRRADHQDIKTRASITGQERFYERRGGVDRPSANPDPDRKVAVFERRCDGFIA
jgi:hypothetical protein